MYIEIFGGLTSRLDVLSSIFWTKEYHEGKIKIIWEKGDGIVANFDDLFKNDLKFYKKSDIDISKLNVSRTKDITKIDLNIPNQYLIADYPIYLHEDILTNNLVDVKNYSQYSHFNMFFKSLIPQDDIQETINYYSKYINYFTVGVNIRRGVGHNYHINSCIFSPDEIFFQTIEHMLKIHPEHNFLITTDSAYTLERMNMYFKNHIFYIKEYRKYPIDGGYSIEGMKRAVIDWFLLAKTRYIIMSKEAGFAKRICRVHNIAHIELVDYSPKTLEYFNSVVQDKGNLLF